MAHIQTSRRSTAFWWLFIFIAAGSVVTWRLWQPNDRVPWRTNFDTARQEAIAAHKPMLLDFNASWCGPCQWMRAQTWSNQTVADAVSDYIPVSIDVDQNPQLAMQYGAQTIPAIFVVDPLTGRVEKQSLRGAMDPAEFLAWLRGPATQSAASAG